MGNFSLADVSLVVISSRFTLFIAMWFATLVFGNTRHLFPHQDDHADDAH